MNNPTSTDKMAPPQAAGYDGAKEGTPRPAQADAARPSTHTTPEGNKVRYAFGQYLFDPHSGELNDGQKTVQLRPQVAKLLALLLANADTIVSREDIRNHLWGSNIVVEFEEGISACVRQLRIALNDGASGTRFIQTVSRRGYKFVFPVNTTEAGAPGMPARPAATPAATAAAPVRRAAPRAGYYAAVLGALLVAGLLAVVLMLRHPGGLFGASTPAMVVAVLPFNNLSPSVDTGLLGDSISGEVINLLGPMAPTRLGVIASTSTAHYAKGNENIKQIGQELGANYVLEGSVNPQSHGVHVSARLIRVADQSYVWGDEYDLANNYSGGTYRELVIRIATQVASILAPSAAVKPLEFTHSQDAALAFQAGLASIGQGEWDKAYGSCRKAMELDPDFAAAYACTARSQLRTAQLSQGQLQDVRKLVDGALDLDPSSAEAHLLKGELDMSYAWDLAGAGLEFKQALRYNPGDALGWQRYAAYLAAMDQPTGMQNAMDTAEALDPAAVSASDDLALVSYIGSQFAKAESAARTNANLNPQDILAQHVLTLSLLGEGKYAAASEQAATEMRGSQASGAEVDAVKSGAHSSLVNYFNWYVDHTAHRSPDKYSAVFLADAYMHLGKPDQAYAVVQAAVKQKDMSTLIPYLSVWPSLKPLCTRPDFLSLTKDLGQPGCLAE